MKSVLKQFALIILAIFSTTSVYGQAPLIKKWDYRFGGTDREFLFSFQQTFDEGYILAGHSNSGISGDKTVASWGSFDFWLVKLDSAGTKLWDKGYGGFDDEALYSVQQTKDKGYILGGWSVSGIGGDKSQPGFGDIDYWVIKIDSLGNKEWDKTFGGSLNDALFSIKQTKDNNYIIGGWSLSGVSGNKTTASFGGADYWVIMIDSVGNKLWEKAYGGTGDDTYHVLEVTSDGGFIFGGFSDSGISGNKTQVNYGDYDYWMVKTDSAGNIQWDINHGGTKLDVLIDIEQTLDGGYIFGGVTFSDIGGNKTTPNWGINTSDYWIIKTDANGTKQWEKDFGGTDHEDDFGTIIQTADKGYFMTGCSYSPISGDKTETNLGFEQTWVIKTDSLGNIMWDKTVITPGHIENAFAVETKDACYTIVHSDDGGIGGFKTQASQGLEDYWIVQLCDTTTIIPPVPPIADFTSTSSDTCGAVVFNFQDISINNPIAWAWLFPGASPANSTNQNPQGISYATDGLYDISLIACNTYGCDTLTNTIQVTIPNNNPVVSLGPDVLLCDNDSVLLSATAGYSNYDWYINGSSISAVNNTIYANQDGNYTVFVTDSIGCKGSDTVNIDVLPVPIADFDYELSFDCNGIELSTTNKSEDALQYLWNFGDGNTSTDINPTHFYNSVQNLNLELIASNANCSDTLTIQNISFEIPEFREIPNVFTPNRDNINDCFQVKGAENLSECYSITIFNRWGNVIMEYNNSLQCWNGEDASGNNLPSGVYFYTINIRNQKINGVIHLLY